MGHGLGSEEEECSTGSRSTNSNSCAVRNLCVDICPPDTLMFILEQLDMNLSSAVFLYLSSECLEPCASLFVHLLVSFGFGLTPVLALPNLPSFCPSPLPTPPTLPLCNSCARQEMHALLLEAPRFEDGDIDYMSFCDMIIREWPLDPF